MRIWSTVQWKVLLCFKVNWRQWCMPGDSGDWGIPQCRIWTPTWEWRGNEVETTTEKVKWGGGNRKVVIEAQALVWTWIFFFKYMCLIMYVRVLLRVIGCGEWKREKERGVLIASATPKKTWKKGGINRREGDYGERERERDSKSQVYTVRQHSPLPWQHSSAAIPKSPCWEAKTRQQQEHIPSLKYSKEGEERVGKVRCRTVYKGGRCSKSTQISWRTEILQKICVKRTEKWAWKWYRVVIQLWSLTRI